MVGYDNRSSQLTSTDFITAGAVSGFLTRAFCQPFDVVKIRFQLQVEPIRNLPNSKYQSLVQASKIIFKEEGITAFWKGHVSAQYLSVTYGITQFYLFETLTEKIDIIELHKSNKLLGNFICGAIAGGGATIVSFPFDVIRTRLIAQGNNAYTNVFSSLQHILINEGVFGLYRGLIPTVIQVAPHAGVQFMSYKFFDNLYRIIYKKDDTSYTFIGSTLAGALSGLISKAAIYPLDLMRKRLQLQGFESNRTGFGKNFVCKNLYDCLIKIYIHEGAQGLFKGLSPSLIKAVITTTLHFNLYEIVCKILSASYSINV